MASAKQPVDAYYMSMHLGVCIGPVNLLGLYYGGKTFWSGEYTELKPATRIDDSMLNLNGGLKKEGGVAGYFWWLPGEQDQEIETDIATRLGKTTETCPAFRGVATVFFAQGRADERGFYWGANTPYVKDVWVRVSRKPAGMDPDMALIPYGDRTPRLIVFAIDCSFSMTDGSPSRIDQVSDALSSLFSALGARADAGLLLDVAIVLFGLGGGTSSAYGADSVALADLLTWFNTHSSATLDGDPARALTGINFYASTTAIAPENRYLFWLSDGSMTRFAYPALTAEDLATETVASVDASYKAFSINVTTGDISALSTLDNTPGDGVPVIDGADTSGLVQAVNKALFPDFIGYDANPANIIYECLTNPVWGMSAPETLLDMDSFNACQTTLYAEEFGMSLMWNQQAKIEDFIGEILNHIRGTLYISPRTGLLTLKLLRNDYDIDDLPEINPDNANLSNLQRKAWGEITNEIQVTWTNPENEQEETVIAQDLGAIAVQGGVISDSRNYYGIRHRELAMAVAQRDLRASAFPLASCEAEIDRSLYDLFPGSVVNVRWPERDIERLTMRVGPINYGKPTDAKIKLSLLEDVFAFTLAEYSDPPATAWTDPRTVPTPMDYTRLMTVPYFFFAAGAPAGLDPDVWRPDPEVTSAVLGADGAADCSGFNLLVEVPAVGGGTEYDSDGLKANLCRGLLASALESEATSTAVTFDTLTGPLVPTTGRLVMIGSPTADEADTEICLITAESSGEFTLRRGVLDTVPRRWAVATEVWFFDDDTKLYDTTSHASGSTANYKLLTRTSGGELSSGSAVVKSVTLSDRPHLPTRPADVKVEGVAFPAEGAEIDASDNGESYVVVTWAERNRKTETATVLAWTAGTVTAEDGQTTTVSVLDPLTRDVITTEDGLTGTSYNLAKTAFGAFNVGIVRVTSKRAGLESLTGHELLVRVDVVTMDETTITMDDTDHTMDET